VGYDISPLKRVKLKNLTKHELADISKFYPSLLALPLCFFTPAFFDGSVMFIVLVLVCCPITLYVYLPSEKHRETGNIGYTRRRKTKQKHNS
jgi:Ca2+/Na+ antiporter